MGTVTEAPSHDGLCIPVFCHICSSGPRCLANTVRVLLLSEAIHVVVELYTDLRRSTTNNWAEKGVLSVHSLSCQPHDICNNQLWGEGFNLMRAINC